MGKESKNKIVWTDEAQTVCDVDLYPIQMRNYTQWQSCKHALLIRQSTLPAEYVFMPYLNALHAVDTDRGTQFIPQIVLALSLATRLPYENFALYAKNNDGRALECIAYRDEQTLFAVDARNFAAFRSTIVEQNGEELPDEGENPELLEAEADIARANRKTGQIDYDMNTLIASVAYQCRRRKSELMDWSIREFVETKNAIDRDKNFMICGIAEKIPMFKWVKGNPCPSWGFDTEKNNGAGMESLGAFLGRTGLNL